MRSLRQIQDSKFVQSVAVLGTGALLAQVVTVAVSPILTRLYSPEDFALAALFAAFLSSIAPAICGKYEVAIVVCKSSQESRQLLGVAFWVALLISLFVLMLILVFGTQLTAATSSSRIGDWLIMLPFMLFFTGLIKGLTSYSNSVSDYQTMARSKLINASVVALGGISLGVLGFGQGLLLSTVGGAAGAVIWLSYRHRLTISGETLRWSLRKRAMLRRYRRFPIYNATTSVLDGMSQAMPIFFLSRYFPEAVVGYYALITRFASAPLYFISVAVSQVFLKKVAGLVHQGHPVRPHLQKVTLALFALSTPLLVFVLLFSPGAFGWIFGEEWRVAGEYLQILIPALVLKFVVSTISPTLSATGNNRLAAVWKLTFFSITLFVFSIAAPRLDVANFFYVMLATDIVLYCLYYLFAWYAAGNPLRHL